MASTVGATTRTFCPSSGWVPPAGSARTFWPALPGCASSLAGAPRHATQASRRGSRLKSQPGRLAAARLPMASRCCWTVPSHRRHDAGVGEAQLVGLHAGPGGGGAGLGTRSGGLGPLLLLGADGIGAGQRS